MRRKPGGESVFRMRVNGPVSELIAPTEVGIVDRPETDCVICGRATLSPHGLCLLCEAREYKLGEL